MSLIKFKKLLPPPFESTLLALALKFGQIVLVNFSQFVIFQLLVPLLHLQRSDFKVQPIDVLPQRLNLAKIRLGIDILLFHCLQLAYVTFEFVLKLSLQVAALLMVQISQPFDLTLQLLVLAFQLLQLLQHMSQILLILRLNLRRSIIGFGLVVDSLPSGVLFLNVPANIFGFLYIFPNVSQPRILPPPIEGAVLAIRTHYILTSIYKHRDNADNQLVHI